VRRRLTRRSAAPYLRSIRGPAGEKVAYARLFSGTVRIATDAFRQRERGQGHRDRYSTAVPQTLAVRRRGQIAQLWARRHPDRRRIGLSSTTTQQHYFALPHWKPWLSRSARGQRTATYRARQLAEQDPLIDLRQDESGRSSTCRSTVRWQKRSSKKRFAADFAIDVTFRDNNYLRRTAAGSGAAAEFNRKDTNPFLATVGLRVEPGRSMRASNSDSKAMLLGTMPLAFFKAVENTVRETLQARDLRLAGHRLHHHGDAHRLFARQSHAHQGFSSPCRAPRRLPWPDAAGADGRPETGRHHGVRADDRFRLEIPADTLGPICRARPAARDTQTPTMRGSSYVIDGDIPAARVYELQAAAVGANSGGRRIRVCI